jgi:alcohol dehydrogenase (NADP+)
LFVPPLLDPDRFIVGQLSQEVIVAAGADVKKFKVGDFAGIGCMVDSCLSCSNCKQGNEQYCSGTGVVTTYNAKYALKQCLFSFGGCLYH